MTEQRVATLVVEVAGRKGNLESILRALQSELRGAGSSADSAANEIGGKLAGGSDKAAASTLKLLQAASRMASEQLKQARAAAQVAAEEAKAAAALGRSEAAAARAAAAQQKLAQAESQAALAAQKLATEAARTQAAQTSAAAAAERLAQAQARGAAAAQGGGGAYSRIGGELMSLAGSFGLATTAAGAAVVAWQQVATGFNLVASIDANRRSLGAFIGDQERANQIFADAAGFADKYKIKQSEIGTALQGLAPLLRTSTTETEKQLEVLTRLQSLNTKASFSEAAFSVKELAGGDYASIVEQFNLSRAAAQRLRDEVAAGADVFAVLDAELAKMGATADVLAQRTIGAAGAQAAFGKGVEDLQIAIGNLVEGPGTGFLNFLAQATNGGAILLNGLNGQGNAFTQNAAQIAASAGSYEQYIVQLNAANGVSQGFIAANSGMVTGLNALLPGMGTFASQMLGLATQTDALSQSQLLYVQGLTAQGVAAEQAVAQAEAQSNALATIETVVATSNGTLDGYQQRLLATAAASDQSLQAVVSLATAYSLGTIDAETLDVTLTALQSTHQANTEAAAVDAAAAEADAAAKAEAAAQSQAYSDAISIETGALTENLTKKLEGEIQTQRLAQAQGFLASLGSQVANGLITAGNAAAQLASKYGIASAEAARLIQLQATLARTQAVSAAGFSGVPEAYLGAAIGGRAGGSTIGPKTTVLTQIAAETEVASKRYEQSIRDYEAAERKAARGPAGGGGGGAGAKKTGGPKTPKMTEAEREQQRLLEQERKFQEARLRDQEKINSQLQDAELEHYDRLLDIQAEYEEKNLAQQKKNEVDKRRSRFDFYSDLTSSDLPQDIQQSLSAAYEAAFAEASRLSQEGKSALANDYLALKQEQIAAEQEFQEAVAQARKDGDQAEVERLQRLAQLRRDAEAEEEKQLLEGGDKNVADRDEALAEESVRYGEEQAKIAGVAEEAANRKIEASKRTQEETAREIAQLREQADLLKTINDQKIAGGGAGAAALSATAPTTSPTPTETPAVQASANSGGIVATRDEGSIAGLAAIERRLDDLARAVRSLADSPNYRTGG